MRDTRRKKVQLVGRIDVPKPESVRVYNGRYPHPGPGRLLHRYLCAWHPSIHVAVGPVAIGKEVPEQNDDHRYGQRRVLSQTLGIWLKVSESRQRDWSEDHGER